MIFIRKYSIPYTADRFRMMGYALEKMEILPRIWNGYHCYVEGRTESILIIEKAIQKACQYATVNQGNLYCRFFLKEEENLIKISLRLTWRCANQLAGGREF